MHAARKMVQWVNILKRQLHFIWTKVLRTLCLNSGVAGAVFGQAGLPAPLKSHHRATARSTYTQGGPAYIKQDSQTSTIWWLILVSAFRKYHTQTLPVQYIFLCLLQKGEKMCVCVCECMYMSLQWLRNPEMNLYRKPLTMFCGWFCTGDGNKLAGKRILSA